MAKKKSSSKKSAAKKSAPKKATAKALKGKTLVVVEAPGKVSKIQGYLGPNYVVRASVGHIMDLPPKKLGVDVDNDYNPTYEVSSGKEDVVSELKDIASKVNTAIICSDEDREGEFIGYSVAMQIKRQGLTIKRAKFNSITKAAIQKAIANPGSLDKDLVRAQQGRRILDRLVGFKVSPLLWSSVRKGLSAGRVQSVGLRIIVDRQKEIDAFKPEDYWTLHVEFTLPSGESFVADHPKKFKKEADVKAVLKKLQSGQYQITKVDSKKTKKSPPPPFTTSAMVQQCNTTLGWGAKRTNAAAQKLYEAGYCVTPDALVQLSDGRIVTIQQAVEEQEEKLYGYSADLQGKPEVPILRHLSRPAPDTLIELVTEKNLSIRVTPEHPFPVLDSLEGVRWIPAGELKEGDYIACPDRLQIEGKTATVSNLLERLSQDDQQQLLVLLEGTGFENWLKEIPLSASLAESTRYKHLRNKKITAFDYLELEKKHPEISEYFVGLQTRAPGAKPVLFSYQLKPEFWRWIGLVLGDGSVSESYISISKPDITPEVFTEYCSSFVSNYEEKKSPLLGSVFVFLLKSLGYESGRKAEKLFVPDIVQQLDSTCLAAFVAGLWDSDGSIHPSANKSKSGCKLSYSSRSELMVEQVRSILLRFGIFASKATELQEDIQRRAKKYAEQNGTAPIFATGDQHYLYLNTSEWGEFEKHIIPWLIVRKEQAQITREAVLKRGCKRDKRTKVPITKHIEVLRQEQGITKKKLGELVDVDYWNYVGSVRKGRTTQSHFNREQTAVFGEFFNDKCLQQLGNCSLTWEGLKSVTQLDNSKSQICDTVYDFSTGTENFVCNGFLVHNCTYIRTDSTVMDPQAVTDIRTELGNIGAVYLPKVSPTYKNKANAQEAHEAIRPTDFSLTNLQGKGLPDEVKLYELIFKRAMASQSTPAEFDRVAVAIENSGETLTAKGQTLRFDGYLKFWTYSDTKEVVLPKLSVGQQLKSGGGEKSKKHTTKPPPRYNTASIIKELEETGVGRPSTYQSIIETLLNRSYIVMDGKAFVPTEIGKEVANTLEEFIPRVVDVGFTAKMEEKLDEVAGGKLDWVAAIDFFWKQFEKDIEQAGKDLATRATSTEHNCGKCGAPLVRRVSSGGPFYVCTNVDPAKVKKSKNAVINNIKGKPFCGQIYQIGENKEPVEKEVEIYEKPCPTCGAPMVKKTARRGGTSFWGCSNYSLTGCKTTCSLDGEMKIPSAAKVIATCDKCGKGNMIIKGSRRGPFVACDRYPKCKNAKNLKDFNIDKDGNPLPAPSSS